MIKGLTVGAALVVAAGAVCWWQSPGEEQSQQLLGMIEVGNKGAPAALAQETDSSTATIPISGQTASAPPSKLEDAGKDATLLQAGKRVIPHYGEMNQVKELMEKIKNADAQSAKGILASMKDGELAKSTACLAAEFGYTNSTGAKDLMLEALSAVSDRQQYEMVQAQVKEIFAVAAQGKVNIDRLCR